MKGAIMGPMAVDTLAKRSCRRYWSSDRPMHTSAGSRNFRVNSAGSFVIMPDGPHLCSMPNV